MMKNLRIVTAPEDANEQQGEKDNIGIGMTSGGEKRGKSHRK